MDNAQKAIMIGVGLFITIIIIAAVMLITGMGQNLLNKGSNKVAAISGQLDMTELEAFDGTVVNGSQVLSTIKKYWTDENIIVYVGNTCTTYNNTSTAPNSTNKGVLPSGTTIAPNDSHSTDTIGSYNSTATGDKAIGTSTRYDAYLIRINDSAVGIYFNKK